MAGSERTGGVYLIMYDDPKPRDSVQFTVEIFNMILKVVAQCKKLEEQVKILEQKIKILEYK
jgi:hypothetical protein